MTIKEVLTVTHHRPWELPSGKWKFYQEWNKAVFLHWQIDYDVLRKFVPEELEIDLFEGSPWVSIVGFTMENVRPNGIISFPPVSNFDEINIRTYVKGNGKPGVYFLSIEGGNVISCVLAKNISELPYRYSKMSRTGKKFDSVNSKFNEHFQVEYTVGKEIEDKSDIEKWLTERYALFQDSKKTINQYEIHHIEWPLFEITCNSLKINYGRFDKLIQNEPALCYYSSGVKVLAWAKQKL